jgi:hypothetical protein
MTDDDETRPYSVPVPFDLEDVTVEEASFRLADGRFVTFEGLVEEQHSAVVPDGVIFREQYVQTPAEDEG